MGCRDRYPAIVLDEEGGVVEGDVLTSPQLGDRWEALDDFEGEAYRRVSTKVLFEDGSSGEAYVYVLRT